MTAQPGYDALASLYATAFPTAFTTALEKQVADAFIHTARTRAEYPGVIDVGCGIGHVAAYLAASGCVVSAVDPSSAMLQIAREIHPHIDFWQGDALLADIDLSQVDALVARFSLIHLSPDEVGEVLASWRRRLPPDALVLVAAQSSDEQGTHEFDHAVARAWRWHPDTLAGILVAAGFVELWRTVSRPGPGHRFPEVHLVVAVPPDLGPLVSGRTAV
ncbi:class I SAM-dependent methyltransferase [Gordonia oryzae]|uniref:Class I SAM-dependent methyltransferase n=1 Tax=Gordonia oryzae TaxID=2487349 RepID=A0A3N4GSW9_9ACTN|nr:class I SAM-dependent methyltransferase [Gordonia oryzae]RPA66113.1 class I SAM-dependent methyltransferase [Gordonia oryzae]